jgi:hypothetical protein
MNNYFTCLKCGRNNFPSKFAVYGHQRLECVKVCEDKNADIDLEYEVSETHEANGVPASVGDFEGMIDDIVNASRDYLNVQKLTLSPAIVECITSGYPRLLDSSRKRKGDLPTYFEIAEYLNNVVCLTSPEADGFLSLLKRVTHMNGNEIPLPSRYV